MAIGLARMFGVRLPLNFNSPYKAGSIIEFWRRWHMTLSRFLRDYLYFPLGGNKRGRGHRYGNLMVVMLLGGLWHGAGWNFALWGALHGTYLIINHLWRGLAHGTRPLAPSFLARWAGRTITLLTVVVAWVLFRATTIEGAGGLLASMSGLNGIDDVLGLAGLMPRPSADFAYLSPRQLLWIGGLWAVCWFCPNTQEWMCGQRPALDFNPRPFRRSPRFPWRWRTTWPYAVATIGVTSYAVLNLFAPSEFLYFQF